MMQRSADKAQECPRMDHTGQNKQEGLEGWCALVLSLDDTSPGGGGSCCLIRRG